jgi:chromosome segregation ATPase|tara:strand:+ start:170 stop:637 length:468 start_codon:yes stop_codon:yes gene_type:complete
MKNRDPNYLVKLEKAISEKYGPETIANPKSSWNEDKEKDYKQQIKKWQDRKDQIEYKNEKIEQDGFFISKKLLNKESNDRTCPICAEYSFDLKDDVFMAKFNCCYKCHHGTQFFNEVAKANRKPKTWKVRLKRTKRRIMKKLARLIKRCKQLFRR